MPKKHLSVKRTVIVRDTPAVTEVRDVGERGAREQHLRTPVDRRRRRQARYCGTRTCVVRTAAPSSAPVSF